MGEDKFNISDLLETHRRDRERLAWEGTFRDYFELVSRNPRLKAFARPHLRHGSGGGDGEDQRRHARRDHSI